MLSLVENFIFRFKISSDRSTVFCLVKDENFLELFLSSKDTTVKFLTFHLFANGPFYSYGCKRG